MAYESSPMPFPIVDILTPPLTDGTYAGSHSRSINNQERAGPIGRIARRMARVCLLVGETDPQIEQAMFQTVSNFVCAIRHVSWREWTIMIMANVISSLGRPIEWNQRYILILPIPTG